MKMPVLKSFRLILWIFILGAASLTNGYVDVLFNSDAHSPHQLIQKNGYRLEIYHVQTPDGYVLELQRIPYSVKKGGKGNHFPILLIHGFIDSSFAWIANGPDRSLAYLLADQGYDIWMINFRGNEFSQDHVNYTTGQPQFWDFSFHEMAIYDLPTTIDFILNETNHQQLLCMADSAGNAVFYMMLSELPQYNDKIVAQVGLALFYHPRMHPGSSTSTQLKNLVLPEISGPLLQRDLLTKLGIQLATALQLLPDGYTLYDLLLYFMYGLRHDHINREVMPDIYNNFPSGTSLKVLKHISQLHDSFSFYDHGPAKNLKLYGTPFPPEYNVSNIHTPVRIYHAKNDFASTPKEAQMLYDKLSKKAGLVQITDPNYSHMDFIYNRHNNELLNNDVVDFVNSIIKNSTKNSQVL